MTPPHLCPGELKKMSQQIRGSWWPSLLTDRSENINLVEDVEEVQFHQVSSIPI